MFDSVVEMFNLQKIKIKLTEESADSFYKIISRDSKEMFSSET
jgi:hypothetical protein